MRVPNVSFKETLSKFTLFYILSLPKYIDFIMKCLYFVMSVFNVFVQGAPSNLRDTDITHIILSYNT